RMLDMGFIRDIRRILAMLPKNRQNLLFSATFSDEIRILADTLLDHPAMIEVARRNATVDATTQKIHPVDRDRKRELLSHLIKTRNWFQVLVFTRTKHGANKLAEQLNKDGITALAIHGNKSQGARTRALSEFKTATLQVLVATDIAARGIDIDQLPHVVNYDLPNVPEDYVHRIGRTGRAGATGEAISLVCVDEHAFLRDIERLIKREIESEIVAGFEPDRRAVAQPIQQRPQRGARAGDPSGAKSRPRSAGTSQSGRGGVATHAKKRGDERTAQGKRGTPGAPRATHATASPSPATQARAPATSAHAAPRTPAHAAKPGVRRFGGRYK
ncbi:MAG TPA: helicase-related protein, partial [Casimicrobiaceae bacterium]|nr:helicase-related protein [Casimicrobiaceae bacterium]